MCKGEFSFGTRSVFMRCMCFFFSFLFMELIPFIILDDLGD